MYQTWVSAKTFSTLPSDILKIPDDPYHELLRFELDNAVMVFGKYVDSKLEELDKDHKRKYKTLESVKALRKTPEQQKPAENKKFVGSKRLVRKSKGR